MVNIPCKLVNPKNYKDVYNQGVEQYHYEIEVCDKCSHVGFHKHGTYPRNIIIYEEELVLEIVRIKCTQCGRTHALIPNFAVPYCQYSVMDMINIITLTFKALMCFLGATKIPEETVFSIRKRYKRKWKERLRAFGISFDVNLIPRCLSTFAYQFMQCRWCTFFKVLQPT